MSVEFNESSRGPIADAAPILERSRAAFRRASARLSTEIEDLRLSDAARLDDRTRAAVAGIMSGLVQDIAARIAATAEARLADEGVAHLISATPKTVARLSESGLLHDRELMTELLSQVRHALLAEALATNRPPGAQASLMARYVDHPDDRLRMAATHYLLAKSRRLAPGARHAVDLPPDMFRRLAWLVAAALRQAFPADSHGQAAVDRALAWATQQLLMTEAQPTRLDLAAMELAAAIDRQHAGNSGPLIDALEEGRVALFIAIIAHGLSIDFAEARTLVLDPDGDRLWLALRAQDLDRADVARIALALSDADPRRDIEAFADELDGIAAISPVAARDALAPLSLDPDFRAALRMLEQAGAR